jgi:adenosine deaminase
VKFAELHLHLYGTIRPAAFLEWVRDRDVEWGFYERLYEEAYGWRPAVREIVERHRAGDPAARREFDELFVFGDGDGGNFDRFQAKFALLISGSEFTRLHRYDDPVPPLVSEMEFFVRAMLADQRRDGIGYAEQRILMGNTLPIDHARRALEALLDLYREEAVHGLDPRLAVGLPREDPWPMWELVKELALGPRGELLTGIDFCHVEEGFPPRDKASFFRAVHAFNQQHPERAIAILYHVGESFSDKSLESAIRWVQEAAELGAHRLGHAIALGVDPSRWGEHTRSESVAERLDQIAYDLEHAPGLERHGVRVDRAALEREGRRLALQRPDERVEQRYDGERLDEVRARQAYALRRVRSTGAVIEVCPTSNRRIADIASPEHHPVHRFLEHDLPLVVGTDDPGLFGTNPAQEIAWVERFAGLEPEAAREILARAWDCRSEVLTGRVPR